MQLLIVDDEAQIREVISESVEDLFADITEAEDGAEAYRKILLECPDAILSDFNMPNVNGFELVKLLRDQKLEIPVILLTGRGTEQIRREAWTYGVYDYFEKPFDLDAIRKTLLTIKKIDTESAAYKITRAATAISFDSIDQILKNPTFKSFYEYCLKENFSSIATIEKIIQKQ